MLLPQYLWRQHKLQRALINYPLYDPPHKIEERVLPEAMARENFQYFLDVREERVRCLLSWLGSEFGVEADLSPRGIGKVLDWALEYTAVLMPPLDSRKTGEVFLQYAEPWTGAYAGANAFFDLGALLGEAIIRKRPTIQWQMEWSLSHFPNYKSTASKEEQLVLLSIERDVRHSKREKRSGFRRPLLASANNSLDYEPVYDMTLSYYRMMTQSVTVGYAWRNVRKPKGLRSKHPSGLRRFVEKAMARSAIHRQD